MFIATAFWSLQHVAILAPGWLPWPVPMGCGPSASKKYASDDDDSDLKRASESQRADRQIVLAAVKKDGSVLMFFLSKSSS